MKTLFLISDIVLSTNAFAHVSTSVHAPHVGEQILLAMLLIPAVWMIVHKVFNK